MLSKYFLRMLFVLCHVLLLFFFWFFFTACNIVGFNYYQCPPYPRTLYGSVHTVPLDIHSFARELSVA